MHSGKNNSGILLNSQKDNSMTIKRPDSISQQDIECWDKQIENDPGLPKGFANDLEQKEVLYCGLWLHEQLYALGCDQETIDKLQYTAGSLSYGFNPWNIHQVTLAAYIKWKTGN